MKNDHMPVSGHLAVELDHIDAGFDRFLESEPSILGIFAGSAAMSDFFDCCHESLPVGRAVTRAYGKTSVT